jgi:phage shock protein PspC (stress-responsive transcriptional regulator)
MVTMQILKKHMDVFKNTDGDYHVHILVDSNFHYYLLKIDFVIFAYAWLLRAMSFILPFLIIVAYIIVSIIKPKQPDKRDYSVNYKGNNNSENVKP